MKKYSLLFFSISVSFLVYLLLVFLEFQNDGTIDWFVRGGDTKEYLCYGENMLHGEYRCDNDILTRMPGLPALYAVFRLLADKETAMLMIVWLQILMGGISMLLLSRIAKINVGIKFDIRLLIVFFSSLFVYKIYDSIVLTESIAVSTMIICLYLIFKEQRKYADYLLAGACITWCVFLRPFTILFIALAALYILYKNYNTRSTLIKSFLPLLVFLLPFILVESVWVTRNYKATGKFILLQDNSRYAGLNNENQSQETSYVKLWSWMMAVGEDGIFWNPGSMGSWMFGGEFKPDTFLYKQHMYSNSYSIKEIEQIRMQYQMQLKAQTPIEKDSIEKVLLSEIDKMIVSYKNDRPFQYHFIAPFRILKKTFIHSGPVMPVAPWPEIKQNPFQLLVKIYSTTSYLLVLFLGMIGLAFCWKKNAENLLMSGMAIIILGFLAIYLRYTEFRLFIIIFPLLAVYTIFTFDYSFEYLRTKLRKREP